MNTILKYIWFELLMRPLVMIILGTNVRNYPMLFKHKQMIIAANHNSHLDTMVLMTLFPFRKLRKVRPVAAEDYFCKSKFVQWFTKSIIQIIPISRRSFFDRETPLRNCDQALKEGYSLILYPEGTRGKPEQLNTFKTGIAHLAKANPEMPVVPIFCHGLGKALPKGETMLVPFYCDIFIGEEITWNGNRIDFMNNLNNSMKNLAKEGNFISWN